MSLMKKLTGKASSSKKAQTSEDTDTKAQAPKRNIAKEIKHSKRRFDYLVIPTEEGLWFVIDADVRADKAAQMFLNHRPQADAVFAYREGRARFNVTLQDYEIVPEDAPVQGTFKVHMFLMED